MDKGYRKIIGVIVTVAFIALTIFNLVVTWNYVPSDDRCSAREIAWSPVSKTSTRHAWKFFPRSTLFTESEFVSLSTPIQDLEDRWLNFLPGKIVLYVTIVQRHC
jgi:hypothetical protein